MSAEGADGIETVLYGFWLRSRRHVPLWVKGQSNAGDAEHPQELKETKGKNSKQIANELLGKLVSDTHHETICIEIKGESNSKKSFLQNTWWVGQADGDSFLGKHALSCA